MENEKQFFYKSFMKTIYALFGLFVVLNGFFVYRSGKKLYGALMIGGGAVLLYLFWYFSKNPYLTLYGTSKLKYKSHPFYPAKLISKDYVEAVNEIKPGLFKIEYKDSNGDYGKAKISIGLLEKDMQEEAIRIIKSFNPDNKNDNQSDND